MRATVRNTEAAGQQAAEIRRETQRLELLVRDLEDSLRAATMELSVALRLESTSGRIVVGIVVIFLRRR